MLSRKKDYLLSDEDYEIVQKCTPWLEKVDKILNIIDKNVSADGAYAILMEDLKKQWYLLHVKMASRCLYQGLYCMSFCSDRILQ